MSVAAPRRLEPRTKPSKTGFTAKVRSVEVEVSVVVVAPTAFAVSTAVALA
jgi:hypothetical protein